MRDPLLRLAFPFFRGSSRVRGIGTHHFSLFDVKNLYIRRGGERGGGITTNGREAKRGGKGGERHNQVNSDSSSSSAPLVRLCSAIVLALLPLRQETTPSSPPLFTFLVFPFSAKLGLLP